MESESIPTPELTPAEEAVLHILQRVVTDRDFSWVMMGTQSLRLCLIAEGHRIGKPDDEVEADLHKAMAAQEERLRNNNADKPEVLVLRQRVETLERRKGNTESPPPRPAKPRSIAIPEVVDVLREMYDAGKLLYPEYREMAACLS